MELAGDRRSGTAGERHRRGADGAPGSPGGRGPDGRAAARVRLRPARHQPARHRPEPSRPAPGPYSSPTLLEALSPREREVLIEVAGGWSNPEIGERLCISAATAKTHVSRLLTKLGAHGRAQLVTIAYETGLLTPEQPFQHRS